MVCWKQVIFETITGIITENKVNLNIGWKTRHSKK